MNNGLTIRSEKDISQISREISISDFGFNDNENVKLFKGNSPLIAAKVDSLLRPYNIRAADLFDFSKKDIIKLVKGKYNSYAPSLILRTLTDNNQRNMPLIENIVQEIEKKYGRVKLPVLISGFDVKPSKGYKECESIAMRSMVDYQKHQKKVISDFDLKRIFSSYNLEIFAREDFTAIQDDRLKGEHDKKKFSKVDEFGLPLFNKRGSRTWYCRNNGLSGIGLFGGIDLASFFEDLVGSDENYRTILINYKKVQLPNFFPQ